MRWHLALLALSPALVASCGDGTGRLPSLADPPRGVPDGGAGAPLDAGFVDSSTKPTIDGSCEYHSVVAKRTPARVYFVVDRSGSMKEFVGEKRKSDAVYAGIVNLARAIGYKGELGASIYPYGGPCSPGVEVLPLQPGDPRSFFESGKTGPVAQNLSTLLFAAPPSGGTPTAATLTVVRNKLSTEAKPAAKGTFVVLATDGGPNCNQAAKCGPEACIANIEKTCMISNCCDPAVDPMASPTGCLDDGPTLSAVSSLAAVGVKVLVVGIPGSEAYASLLEAMAVAGGAPRPTAPRYYRVDDLDQVEAVFAALGDDIPVSCTFSLDAPPEDDGLVNLYFDDQVIPKDPVDGWSYDDATTISVRGKACDQLNSGLIQHAEVFVGCPSIVK